MCIYEAIRRADMCKCDLCQNHKLDLMRMAEFQGRSISQPELNKTLDKNVVKGDVV